MDFLLKIKDAYLNIMDSIIDSTSGLTGLVIGGLFWTMYIIIYIVKKKKKTQEVEFIRNNIGNDFTVEEIEALIQMVKDGIITKKEFNEKIIEKKEN